MTQHHVPQITYSYRRLTVPLPHYILTFWVGRQTQCCECTIHSTCSPHMSKLISQDVCTELGSLDQSSAWLEDQPSIQAVNGMDTIDKLIWKFTGRQHAKSGLIRHPTAYMMVALPFELPALRIAYKTVIDINQRTIISLSLKNFLYAVGIWKVCPTLNSFPKCHMQMGGTWLLLSNETLIVYHKDNIINNSTTAFILGT